MIRPSRPFAVNQIKLLETFPEIEIVGEALSGESALEKVEECKPEVVLLDLGLPQMSGIVKLEQGSPPDLPE